MTLSFSETIAGLYWGAVYDKNVIDDIVADINSSLAKHLMDHEQSITYRQIEKDLPEMLMAITAIKLDTNYKRKFISSFLTVDKDILSIGTVLVNYYKTILNKKTIFDIYQNVSNSISSGSLQDKYLAECANVLKPVRNRIAIITDSDRTEWETGYYDDVFINNIVEYSLPDPTDIIIPPSQRDLDLSELIWGLADSRRTVTNIIVDAGNEYGNILMSNVDYITGHVTLEFIDETLIPGITLATYKKIDEYALKLPDDFVLTNEMIDQLPKEYIERMVKYMVDSKFVSSMLSVDESILTLSELITSYFATIITTESVKDIIYDIPLYNLRNDGRIQLLSKMRTACQNSLFSMYDQIIVKDNTTDSIEWIAGYYDNDYILYDVLDEERPPPPSPQPPSSPPQPPSSPPPPPPSSPSLPTIPTIPSSPTTPTPNVPNDSDKSTNYTFIILIIIIIFVAIFIIGKSYKTNNTPNTNYVK